MPAETLIVPRAPLDLEEPWTTPPECRSVRLRRSTDAAAPRLSTTVAAWFDDDYLSVLFSAADDHILADYTGHDDPLYEQDVVELFLAPEELTRYYEIEVSPLGTLFDAAVDSPNGSRDGMHVERRWTCEGIFVAIRKMAESTGEFTLDYLVRIPFYALERSTPGDGEEWRGNFFRIDRHPRSGDEFTAWQPTLVAPPDFHRPHSFGVLRFRG